MMGSRKLYTSKRNSWSVRGSNTPVGSPTWEEACQLTGRTPPTSAVPAGSFGAGWYIVTPLTTVQFLPPLGLWRQDVAWAAEMGNSSSGMMC